MVSKVTFTTVIKYTIAYMLLRIIQIYVILYHNASLN